MLRKSRCGRLGALALGAWVLSSATGAHASDFTVHDGDTLGQQNLTDPGDTGTIEKGGTVETSGGTPAVTATGSDNTVNNHGTITGSGDSWSGVYSIGPYAVIDNDGTIDGSGNFVAGIYAAEHDAHVTNRGTILTSGFQTGGISSDGNDAVVDNRGTITTTSDNGLGIVSSASNARIFNSGSIEVTGASAQAVLAYGDNPTFTNSGKIVATDSSSFAIVMYGNATLNLLAGTAIQNDFYFGDATNTHLNIGTGLNTALYFYNGPPANIDTSGQPYVIAGDVLAVADPTGLAAANSFALDLARSISDAAGTRSGMASTGGGGSDTASGDAGGRGIWATGLGFHGDHQPVDWLDGYHYGAGGFMVGADQSLSASTAAGLFGGLSTGKMATDADSAKVTSFGGFAGAYWLRDDGAAFTRLSLVAGGVSNDSDRTVANNKVAGGLETAEATYSGFYVSPAFTFGLHHNAGGAVVSPSLGLRYTGFHRGGYAETGSLADMTVDGATAQSIDVRGEVKTEFAPHIGDKGTSQFNARAGLDGIFTFGDAVEAELLGSDVELLGGGQRTTARAFVGAGGTFTAADGTAFNAGVEGSYDTDAALTVSATAGVRRAF